MRYRPAKTVPGVNRLSSIESNDEDDRDALRGGSAAVGRWSAAGDRSVTIVGSAAPQYGHSAASEGIWREQDGHALMTIPDDIRERCDHELSFGRQAARVVDGASSGWVG